MRILHMTPPIINNGVYRYIFTLLKYIDKTKFQFEFLMQNPTELMETKECNQYHFAVKSFTTTQRENPEKFRHEIYDILSDGYDALELHTSYWRGFMIEEIAMEIGIPKVIVHSHSSGLDNNDLEERIKQLAIHEQFKRDFNCNYATDFWACSKEAGDWLFGEQIPRDKIKIMHNAIEVKNYLYHEDVRKQKRKDLGVENSFVIGNISRFEYQKNHGFLIEVFSRVCRKIDNAILLLVGEGELKQDIMNRCNQLGIADKVIFSGWREDISDLLQAMDLFAFPSIFEGLGIALVEAQTTGLFCLASDTIPEEVAMTDNCRRLPLNQNEWFNNIVAYNESPYIRTSKEYEVTKAGYNIEIEVHNIEKLYLEK